MVLLAVNGTLMRGLELNPNLVTAGATFVREARTSPEYRLFSLGRYPGMIKVPLEGKEVAREGGAPSDAQVPAPGEAASVHLEIWDVPEPGLVSVLLKEPPGLCIGKVTVLRGHTAAAAAGSEPSDAGSGQQGGDPAAEDVLGVLAEPWAVKGRREITSFGGWRAYIASLEAGEASTGQEAAQHTAGASEPPGAPAAPSPLSIEWLVAGIGQGPGQGQVRAMPYNWPYDGRLSPDNTVLLVIDMQVDFCGRGGYVDQMGYDISLTRASIEPIRRVLAACRGAGVRVIHTREGHRADLSDLPANKRWRSEQIGAGIGSQGPMGRVLVRGEEGWDIIPELKPLPNEPVVDKPGKGSFFATDLDLLLRGTGARNIVLTGITTDVCVHTTMRAANDMGYECLLLADCTGATDWGNYESALKMVTMQGGVFGAVSFAEHFVQSIC